MNKEKVAEEKVAEEEKKEAARIKLVNEGLKAYDSLKLDFKGSKILAAGGLFHIAVENMDILLKDARGPVKAWGGLDLQNDLMEKDGGWFVKDPQVHLERFYYDVMLNPE